MTLKELINREDYFANEYSWRSEMVMSEREKMETDPDLANNHYWHEMVERDSAKADAAKTELESVRKELADYIRNLLEGGEVK